MPVYVIAQLRFTDRQRYDRYQARFGAVFARFNGRLLAADEQLQVLEGAWERDKVVMMEFPDDQSARAFRESPDYREIAVDRLAGADAVVLEVRGLR